MSYKKVLFAVHLLIYTVSCTKHQLNNVLKYYEIIKLEEAQHHIVKRNLNELNHHRRIAFHFNGKKHHLHLQQTQEILSPDFKAFTIDANGRKRQIHVDTNTYYKGVLEEDADSSVIAHVDEDLINAEIITKNDSIFIEPLQPHLDGKISKDMIIYKLSDVLWNLTESKNYTKLYPKTCGVEIKPEKNMVQSGSRNRRSTKNMDITNNICELALVADFEYFTNIGESKEINTINYMIQVITRVHNIYKKTDFVGVGENIGFNIKEIIVHNKHNNIKYNKKHNGPWNVDQLLTAFSRSNWSGYCLAHLFTYQDFSNGIIGLAYVASPRIHEVGGICTKSYSDAVGRRYLNCGLSSSKNWGRRLLTVEADLVTAHEIGHNFGSNHDPANCQPTEKVGGKYIMYAHSVSGEQDNNKMFSPCSKKAMGQVLLNKKSICFTTAKKGQVCGNNIVEDGEECDVGLLKKNSDKCCSSTCMLKKGSQCSDINDQCCTNCSFASKTKVCHLQSTFHCTAQTTCTGLSKLCPNATGLNGNETCGFKNGNCQGGHCVPLCEQRNLTSCNCNAGPNSCKICCTDPGKTSCLVLQPETNEKDGAPCLLGKENGQCVGGVCKKNKQNVEDEFSSLLNDFTLDKFVRLMKTNIVGTVLFFSLVMWIPASIAVYYIDKKHEEENDFMENWMNPKNKQLLHKEGKLGNFFKKDSNKKKVRSQYHISS